MMSLSLLDVTLSVIAMSIKGEIPSTQALYQCNIYKYWYNYRIVVVNYRLLHCHQMKIWYKMGVLVTLYYKLRHCLYSDSASPKPVQRRRATLIIFVMEQCRSASTHIVLLSDHALGSQIGISHVADSGSSPSQKIKHP